MNLECTNDKPRGTFVVGGVRKTKKQTNGQWQNKQKPPNSHQFFKHSYSRKKSSSRSDNTKWGVKKRFGLRQTLTDQKKAKYFYSGDA